MMFCEPRLIKNGTGSTAKRNKSCQIKILFTMDTVNLDYILTRRDCFTPVSCIHIAFLEPGFMSSEQFLGIIDLYRITGCDGVRVARLICEKWESPSRRPSCMSEIQRLMK